MRKRSTKLFVTFTLIITTVLLTMTGCRPENSINSQGEEHTYGGSYYEEIDWEKIDWSFYSYRSKEFVQAMAEGDFVSAKNMLHQDMEINGSFDWLPDQWDYMIDSFGNFSHLEVIDHKIVQDLFVNYIETYFSEYLAVLQITFNEVGEVMGLFIKDATPIN